MSFLESPLCILRKIHAAIKISCILVGNAYITLTVLPRKSFGYTAISLQVSCNVYVVNSYKSFLECPLDKFATGLQVS